LFKVSVFQSFKDFAAVREACLPAFFGFCLKALNIFVYARILGAQLRMVWHEAIPLHAIHSHVGFKARKQVFLLFAP